MLKQQPEQFLTLSGICTALERKMLSWVTVRTTFQRCLFHRKTALGGKTILGLMSGTGYTKMMWESKFELLMILLLMVVEPM